MAVRGVRPRARDFLLLVVLTTLLRPGHAQRRLPDLERSPQTAAALGIAVTLWLVLRRRRRSRPDEQRDRDGSQPRYAARVDLINPLDVYKLLGVDLLQTSLDVLGSGRNLCQHELGAALTPLLAGS